MFLVSSNPKSACKLLPPAEVYPKEDLCHVGHPIQVTEEENQYLRVFVCLPPGVIRGMEGEETLFVTRSSKP